MNKYIDLKCDCGCKILHIEKDNDGFVYLSIYKTMFYTEQTSIFLLIKDRINKTWQTLKGKDYCLFDMMIKPEDSEDIIQKIIDGLNEMR